MKLDKAIKITIIIGVLLFSFSVFYYFVIFLPVQIRQEAQRQQQKEQARLEQQMQEQKQEQLLQEKQFQQQELKEQNRQALLESCLDQVKEKYASIFQDLIKACNASPNAYNCGISVNEMIQKQIKDAKDECFKKYP